MGLLTGIALIIAGVVVIVLWAFGRGLKNGARAMKEYLSDKIDDLKD